MRTTITLDPDVVALLEKAQQEQGLSFKEAVNTAIRKGLVPSAGARKPFRLKTYAAKQAPDFDVTHVWDELGKMDDEKLSRKLKATR